MRLYNRHIMMEFNTHKIKRTKRAITNCLQQLNSFNDPYSTFTSCQLLAKFLLTVDPKTCTVEITVFLVDNVWTREIYPGEELICMDRLIPTTIHGYIKHWRVVEGDSITENARIPRVHKKMKIKLGWINSVVKGELR